MKNEGSGKEDVQWISGWNHCPGMLPKKEVK